MSSKWWVLAAVGCGTFMATLDSSIVNIALPTLTKELVTDLGSIRWVVIIYLFAITCLLLPFGRMSDIYGRKRVFQTGFIIFTLGSAFCGVSQSLGALLVSRLIQGAGAAMLMANGPAVVTATFAASERGKALGTLAMIVSAGLLTGPGVGGLMITHLGWRSIFLINIPIGILGVLLAEKYIPKDVPLEKADPFDWAGAFLQGALLVVFTLLAEPPMISFSGSHMFIPPRWILALISFSVLIVFVKVESTAVAPLFDLSLLRIQTFWTANLASFLTFVSYSALTVLMPFFLEGVMKLTPDRAGIYMMAIPITIFVVAPLSGRLSDRMGSRGLSVLGAAVGCITLMLMSGALGAGIHSEMSGVWIWLGLAAIGLATGLFQSPNNNAIMGVVPPNKLGVASALLATVRNLGLATGTGFATALFQWKHQTSDFVESLHFVLFGAALIGMAAVVASFGKRAHN